MSDKIDYLWPDQTKPEAVPPADCCALAEAAEVLAHKAIGFGERLDCMLRHIAPVELENPGYGHDREYNAWAARPLAVNRVDFWYLTRERHRVDELVAKVRSLLPSKPVVERGDE